MGVENNMQNNFGCKLVAVLDMNKLKGGYKSLTQVINGIVYRNIIRLSSTK